MLSAFIDLIKRKTLGVWSFYYDGFRSMTVGKTLWAVILIKLFIFFVVLKIFFFPDILKRDYATDEERAQHVRTVLSGAVENDAAGDDNVKLNNTDTDE